MRETNTSFPLIRLVYIIVVVITFILTFSFCPSPAEFKKAYMVFPHPLYSHNNSVRLARLRKTDWPKLDHVLTLLVHAWVGFLGAWLKKSCLALHRGHSQDNLLLLKNQHLIWLKARSCYFKLSFKDYIFNS